MVEQWDFDSDIIFTSRKFESNGLILIGGMKNEFDESTEGFGGCIQNVILNSRKLDLRRDALQTPKGGMQECR